MKTKMNYFILILGIVILLLANSIGLKYFPANLPFCGIGGGLVGWQVSVILWKRIHRN